MKVSQFAVVGMICLTTLGCRTDPAVQLLERQNRILEDEIWRLRDVVADYESGAMSYPAETPPPESYRPADRPEPEPPTAVDSPEPTPRIDAPRPAPATPETPRSLSPPALQTGEPLQEGELPNVFEKVGPAKTSGPPETAPPDEEGDKEDDQERPEPEPTNSSGPGIRGDSSQVEQLVLNQLLTGGYDSDGRPGDEGIVVVVEPRDAQGRWVEAPAAMSVVVLDPALEGDAARVARWDFSVEQTRALVLRAGLGRGIGLDMDWPDAPPLHTELLVHVRYATSDGRNLQADGRISIELPEGRTAGWVPRPKRATEPPNSPGKAQPTQPAATARPTATARPAEPTNRTAALPSRPTKPEPQRPVWSPDRP